MTALTVSHVMCHRAMKPIAHRSKVLEYSLADLSVGSVVLYSIYLGVPVDAHAEVKGWLAELQARESFRAGWI